MKKEQEEPLVVVSKTRGTTIICINYLGGVRPIRLNRAMEGYKRVLRSMEPVVIVAKDKNPPSWAFPIVQSACKHASRIAVDTREGYPKSCVITVVRNGSGQMGQRIKNPDPTWATLDQRHTRSA